MFIRPDTSFNNGGGGRVAYQVADACEAKGAKIVYDNISPEASSIGTQVDLHRKDLS